MYAYARVPSPPRPRRSCTYAHTTRSCRKCARCTEICVRACTCRYIYIRLTRSRVRVGRSCAACVRVYRRTRVRYVFSNSASRAGSSNLHIYSFTVIQSSLKLARADACECAAVPLVHARTHAAGSSLIHNSSKGLMELQSSRHSRRFFCTLLSCFPPDRGGSGVRIFFTKYLV